MELGESRSLPRPAVRSLAGGDAPLAYHDGVHAVVEIAARFTAGAWDAPTPCADWRAADLAGHLRCVADDYHEYLDDAPVSRLSRLMATGARAEVIAQKLAGRTRPSSPPWPTLPPARTSRRSPSPPGGTSRGWTRCSRCRITAIAAG